MVLNISVEKKKTKSKSVLYKILTLTNDNKNISYKTIKKTYNNIIDNYGYEGKDISVRVYSPVGWLTLKGLGNDEMYDTINDYFKNKVKDPSKFSNEYKEIQYLIY